MTCLTDKRMTEKPMARKDAHNFTAQLATKAYNEKRRFIDVLLENELVTGSLPEDVLGEITDPFKYVGQSREIIHDVFSRYHGRKTLNV